MHITLTYFNVGGRAQATRLAFHYEGIEFEDKFVDFPAFMALKPTLPYGQVPVMEVDGVTYAQSSALLRYAGKLSGLYPEDPLKAMKVDELLAAMEDITGLITPSFKEKDDEKKKEMREALVAGPLSAAMSNICKQLEANPGSWFVGDSLTIADLQGLGLPMMILNGKLDHIPASFLDDFPAIKANYDAVMAEPKIAEYFAAKA